MGIILRLPRFRSLILATVCVVLGYFVGFAIALDDPGRPDRAARIDVTKAVPVGIEWTADARKSAARYADASMLDRGHEVYVVAVGTDSQVLALIALTRDVNRVAAYDLAQEFDFEKLASAGFTKVAIDRSPDPYEISVADSNAAGVILGPVPSEKALAPAQ